MTTSAHRLDDHQLRQLAKLDVPGPVVSMTIPSLAQTRGERGLDEHLTALRREARRALAEAPWQRTGDGADAYLDVAEESVREVDRRPVDALAVFVSADHVACFVLPDPVQATVTVGSHPDLLAALEALTREMEFDLLVLSQSDASLYRADHRGYEPVPGLDLPTGLDDLSSGEPRERMVDGHGGPGGPGGAGPVNAASAKDLRAGAVERYVAQVAAALPASVNDGSRPLVVAAVGKVASQFAAHSSHRDLVLLTEPGSPERRTVEELRVAAVERLLPRRDRAASAAIDRYHSLAGTGRTCVGTSMGRDAALAGQVDTLLVEVTAAQRFEHDLREVLAEAIVATLANGGDVLVVPEAVLGDPVGAVLRY